MAAICTGSPPSRRLGSPTLVPSATSTTVPGPGIAAEAIGCSSTASATPRGSPARSIFRSGPRPTSAAWVKIYNSAAQTCGSGTPVYRGLIVGGTNGAGFISGPINATFNNGISVCVTVNYADSDTTAPAASTFVVNVHWK